MKKFIMEKDFTMNEVPCRPFGGLYVGDKFILLASFEGVDVDQSFLLFLKMNGRQGVEVHSGKVVDIVGDKMCIKIKF